MPPLQMGSPGDPTGTRAREVTGSGPGPGARLPQDHVAGGWAWAAGKVGGGSRPQDLAFVLSLRPSGTTDGETMSKHGPQTLVLVETPSPTCSGLHRGGEAHNEEGLEFHPDQWQRPLLPRPNGLASCQPAVPSASGPNPSPASDRGSPCPQSPSSSSWTGKLCQPLPPHAPGGPGPEPGDTGTAKRSRMGFPQGGGDLEAVG